MAELLQAGALPLKGKHLIEASAGTGKTYNITRLYLRLLLEKQLEVQNILVMTFTRAATAELKGRLTQAISGALAAWGQPTDDVFFQQLHDRILAPQALALLRRAMLHMDEAAIYTIHSFCKRALTQQAFVSGISFHADMDAETRDLILEALQDWYRQQSLQADFAELYSYWDSPDAFFREWAHIIADSELLDVPEMPDMAITWRSLQDAWPEEALHFQKLQVNAKRTADSKAQAQASMDTLTELVAQPWQPGFAAILAERLSAKDVMSTAKKQQAMPALALLLDRLGDVVRATRARWALQGIHYAREHLATAKDRLDQLDFSDLIQRLRTHLLAPDTGPQLAAALGQQFPAALVDEFQDTDPDQYAILDAIYGAARERGLLLCMIGDPKQAIYGFRGGDVFAYLQARDDADYQWVMDTNYRSTCGVITGYNRLFYGASLRAEQGREVFGFGIRYHPVNAGRQDRRGLQDPARRGDFQWCLLPANESMTGLSSKGDSYAREGMEPLAHWTAVEITRLLAEARHDDRAVSPGDIAILVRDRHEANTMQQALRHYGLEAVYLSAQDNVLTSPESDSLFQALNGILHLEDDRQLIAALATPWMGHDAQALANLKQDDHAWARTTEWVAQLREQWFQQGFMKMALSLYQRSLHPAPERHERVLTNGLHLLELLQEASQRHRQPQALMHWFDQSRLEADGRNASETQQLRLESDGELIRLVTLHGSKGLEYPIVFLPFVSYGRDRSRNKPKMVRYHSRQDYRAHRALEPTPLQLSLYEEEQAAEDIRLLYVGATRGEKRVYLLAAPFNNVGNSPLALCCGTRDWPALSQRVKEMEEEGACAALVIDHIPPASDWVSEQVATEPPVAARFTGCIERDWWLSSFSALTRNLRHGGLSTPDRDGETSVETSEVSSAAAELRFLLARGAEAGNLLHDLLEDLDFQQPDYGLALEQAERGYPNLLPPDLDWKEGMRDWLAHLLTTPLPGGASLGALANRHTLRETEFYFPMAAGMQRGELARILAAHRGTSVAALPTPQRLNGMMHGFIDLIYHWQGRYYLVDYKSSHLGDRLTDYHPEALTRNVQQNYYDLQYLLYTLALHRYLRSRLPDYDPQRHLGGVHYLYLRGMHRDHDTGIYHRPADIGALEALDAFFLGSEVSA
ncbi:MAG: exodeoxyribonuclease V subunit beta [Marinobacter sp.]|nr:exodeoxyribonuclease V subunit beta [Marinobacter sp.]